MKKILVVTSLLILSFQLSAQKLALADRKNELKIGSMQLLFGSNVEIAYEHISSNYFTYGATIFNAFGGATLADFDSESKSNSFSINPFARAYFQENKDYGTYGFFLEGATKISSNIGFSLSLGRKFSNKAGFIVEPIFGVGRDIGTGNFYPRGDLFLGYRFK